MAVKKTYSERQEQLGTLVLSSASELGTRIGLVADRIGSRKFAAEVAEISVDQLARYISGESQPSLTPIALMATQANVSLDWVWEGKGQMERGQDADMITVPEYRVEGGAGTGIVATEEEVESIWQFSRALARELGLNPANLAFIRIRGDSMAPAINNGDLVLLDMTQKHFATEGVYAFSLGDMLLVKRIQALPTGDYQVRSDNPEYSPFALSPGADNVKVVGRVVWAIRRLD
jgi:phage repressor protein C with HTH and peptisase S24 domain